MMPIIFAQAIVMIPVPGPGLRGAPGFLLALSDFGGFWYNFLLFSMVVLFTCFYTAITVNPMQLADDMKRNGASSRA